MAFYVVVGWFRNGDIRATEYTMENNAKESFERVKKNPKVDRAYITKVIGSYQKRGGLF